MTWNHDWCTEWRVAFVTRTLDDAEQSRYAAHLPHCPECTLAIADLTDDVALLSLGVTPLEPGPALDPVAAAARIVAASAARRGDRAVGDRPRGTALDAERADEGGLATLVAVDVRDALGLLEILHDTPRVHWAARLRGVPHAAQHYRFRLAYVDDAYEVRRRWLVADGAVVALPLSPEAQAILGATLTVERDGRPGDVVGHLVVGDA